jgi:hypothetical protein
VEGYFLLGIVLTGLIVAVMITRTDRTENDGFSKKTIKKLLAVLGVVFFAVVVVVFVTPESWM